MAATVKQLTLQEQADIRNKYPEADPKEWAVMDGKLTYTYRDTQEEAQQEVDALNLDDRLASDFQEWIDTIIVKYPSMELEHIYEVIGVERA